MSNVYSSMSKVGGQPLPEFGSSLTEGGIQGSNKEDPDVQLLPDFDSSLVDGGTKCQKWDG